jgi:hypothetical protein
MVVGSETEESRSSGRYYQPFVRHRPKNCIKNRIEMLAHVFGEEPEHEVSVFLQQKVFAPIAAVGIRIG